MRMKHPYEDDPDYQALVRANAEAILSFPSREHPALWIGHYLASVLLVSGDLCDSAPEAADAALESIQYRFPDALSEVGVTLVRGLLFVLLGTYDTIEQLLGRAPIGASLEGATDATREAGDAWFDRHAHVDAVQDAANRERAEAALESLGLLADD